MSSASAPVSSSQVVPVFHETRLALRAGVSLLVLAVVAPAMAADRPVPTVSRGANGVDGSAGFLGIGSRNATAGHAGGAVNLADVDVAAAQRSPASTVEIGSAGGNGGAGASFGASVPGADGAAAGNVTVSLNEDLDGRGDQKSAAPRLWVYSRGGKGGSALKDVGAGGAAGTVDLTLSSTVSTAGAAFLGVRVSSTGGNAGYGGTDASITGAKSA